MTTILDVLYLLIRTFYTGYRIMAHPHAFFYHSALALMTRNMLYSYIHLIRWPLIVIVWSYLEVPTRIIETSYL